MEPPDEVARESDPVPQAPPLYRAIQSLLRVSVGAFFRRVEITGLGNIPSHGCGLIVSWHPNGLVDPGLILTQFPRQVVFGARSGLFAFPLLGFVLRRLGTVPIYRAVDESSGDPESRRAANRKSLDALAREVARGSFSALFPEGISHDAPHLTEIKRGAARLYYRARQLRGDREPPVILPVGLHYDKKQVFRSNALVAFHPPIQLPFALDVTPADREDEELERERIKQLTALIEVSLREVVHATDDWELHDLMQRTRRLVRAERAARAGVDPGATSMGERVLGFARVRTGYYILAKRNPQVVARLRARVSEYDADLRALGLEDYELDRDPKLLSPWLAILLVLQSLAVFLLLPPIVAVGLLVNLPTALLLRGFARVGAKLEKDEATIKLLLGTVLFPATWIAAGVAAAKLHVHVHAMYPAVPDLPVLAGMITFVLAGLGGMTAVRYLRVAGETARAVRVRLTRRQRWVAVKRLRLERRKLCAAIEALIEGVELPGVITPEGRVRDED